jgi:hypothetical protein
MISTGGGSLAYIASRLLTRLGWALFGYKSSSVHHWLDGEGEEAGSKKCTRDIMYRLNNSNIDPGNLVGALVGSHIAWGVNSCRSL